VYLIGTTGDFSRRSHRSTQHECIGGLGAELAKVIREFLFEYIGTHLRQQQPRRLDPPMVWALHP
jgi:hypothetical protein